MQERIQFELVTSDDRLPPSPGGTFNPERAIFPIIKRTAIRGLPDTLTDVRVLHDFVDSNQFFYQAYRTGHISEALFRRISAHVDTTVLIPEWIDAITISAAIGKDRSGNRVVIVDTNNDGDFSAEPALHFRPDSLIVEGHTLLIHAAPTVISFEYFEDSQIKRRAVPAGFFYAEGAAPHELQWEVRAYPVGTWTVRGESFRVALEPKAVFRPGKYSFLYVDVDHDGRFDPEPEGLEAYSIGEPFNIGGLGWRVRHLTADGSFLELERVERVVLPRSALRQGNLAPAFAGATLAGTPASLSQLQGKYVLLNFGATWCPYSRAELPVLQAAHAEYAEDPFTILSLVDDESEAGLRQFVQQHELEWPHMYQRRENEIASRYRVLGFPTNYLLDPQGLIVARGSALRGDSLRITLNKHLRSKP